MNHAVVVAAQQFLGFELCCALLEKGWTVTAIDDDTTTVDKWLEIGRNANLHYYSFNSWDKKLPRECKVFLPFYDQVKGNPVHCLSTITTLLKEMHHTPQIIQIYWNNAIEERNHQDFDSFATFYLPTLYGIHQPSQFLFAQLLNHDNNAAGNEYDFIDDASGAIYVKDAAAAIISKISEPDIYSLKSLSKNSWNEALSYLTDKNISCKPAPRSAAGKILTVNPSKSHEMILKEQLRGLSMKKFQE